MGKQEKYKIGFVILHYLALRETINCVNSIEKNISYVNYEIIIVDNGSCILDDDNKLEQLEKTYPNIKLIISKKNLA